MDFSFRRTHGVEAGLKVARASYIAGFEATSNVIAGRVYGIPLSGTMAHSFVTSHEDELEAFRAFARSFPGRSVFLIDTYDTIAGARKAAAIGKEMEGMGQRLHGVRLDSGHLAKLSREVRTVLDQAGGAPIDSFGVGTKMGVSGDAPWLDMAYKMVKCGDRAVLKLSAGKSSLPAEKQVFRLRDDKGRFSEDVISLRDESPGAGEPLLQKLMDRGKMIQPPPSLTGAST